MKKIKWGNIKFYINKIVNSELFIIFTAIALFIKMFFFYESTIYFGDTLNREIMEKTFIFSMFIVTFLFIFKNKARFILTYIINIIFSIIMFADNLYYNYSTSFLSVSQISNLQYSEEISTAIKDLFSAMQLLYFLDIILILILLICRYIKIEKIKEKRWKPALLYISLMTIIYSSTIHQYVDAASAFTYNKKLQLEAGTLYTFHYLDVKTNINLKKNAKYATNSDVMEAYNDLKNIYNEKYEEDIYNFGGIAQGKNVIALQLESFQDFLLFKSINGKEITPNLNKFMKENVQIDNLIIQSYSTTADSEHSALSSLYPLDNGMAFAQYSGNKYDDFFGEFHDAGYYTMYMHGNVGTFWNRNNVYGSMDIDELDFIDSFDENSQLINDWISDESLYIQAAEKINNVGAPFFVNIIAASSHNAFDLPGLENKYDYVDIDVGKYKETYFGNYLEAINYSDRAFGIFIDKLKESGLYDNTVIMVYGDHYGMQMYNSEMLEFIEEADHKYDMVETEINYVNTACGIHIPGVEHIEITKPISKLDIKPTLCYLTGVTDGVSLGSNMFGNKDFACLNNGIIIAEDYYYNGVWYNKSNGEKVNLEQIDDETKYLLKFYEDSMDKELSISLSIVLNNLLK